MSPAADLAIKHWVMTTGAAIFVAPVVGMPMPYWAYALYAFIAWGHIFYGIWFGLRKEIRRGQ